MATLHSGQQQLPLDFTNHFLAHLQVAVHQRFATGGGGFFLTGTYADPDGNEVTVSHWLHPSIPLAFSFDVKDDSDQRIPPVKLDHKEIDAILETMNQPNGVRATGEVWLPFMEKM